MKKYLGIIPFLLLYAATGCKSLKTVKYMKGGSVSRRYFKSEVPFEMRFGLIILKVMIHGRQHNFILDTGAPNAISKELAQQLGIDPEGAGKVNDSQGGSGHLGFTAIDSIGIGDVQFLNTGAAVADLQKVSEIGCLKIDGLIGSNLMRKAIWQFDYERRVITITGSRDSLTIPANAQAINFHPDLAGIPRVDVQMNGHTEHDVTIDLGSNGDFFGSEKTLKMLEKDGLRADTYSYGYGATGLYGKGKPDTTWSAVVGSISLDSVKLTDQVVSFCENKARTIGTNFFKNYRLVFDWSADELTMIPVRPYDNKQQKKFNFTLFLKDNHVFVGSQLFTGGRLVDGPQIGDQVLEIDGTDYRSCQEEQWCTLLSQWFDNTGAEVALLVKRGDKVLKFKTAKEALFRNK